jgi:phosphoribosylaminoimidazole-succinocarboxamide synthase
MNSDILDGLNLLRKGKVREVYDMGDTLLISASDRISAFDVIMNERVPDKGSLLSEISVFWFNKTKEIIDNHFITNDVNEYPEEAKKHGEYLKGRSMIVKKCEPLPVEFVVRGYVAGSGWKEYQQNQEICGNKLPAGLVEYSKIEKPIFTPATKEDTGHDINIDYSRAAEILGEETASYLRDISIKLYEFGRDYLEARGIILADTKFEFGRDENGNLILIDEALTPDSSRFWLKDNYAPGKKQEQFDKQVLRDYLETLDWDKTPPAPTLPEEILEKIKGKYLEAVRLIKS